ncbi:MAG: VPDSG-CTERM sorting domain-containing protein [Opitutaceae bacterium]|nr:VPDSG-CTERM sorting domain-containing protein [Opitutaceae bacterium]
MKLISSLLRGGFAIALLSSSAAVFAATSVLTFDGLGLANYGVIPGSYGDNLANTPNVTVDYRTFAPGVYTTFSNDLMFWDTGYGSLTNVAIASGAGGGSEISLVASAGFVVDLASLNVASFGNVNQTDQLLRVLDGAGNVLADYSPVTVLGAGFNNILTPGVSASTLRIQFGNTWNVAIDNITFGQRAVTQPPTPTGVPDQGNTVLLLGAALVAIAGLRRTFAG